MNIKNFLIAYRDPAPMSLSEEQMREVLLEASASGRPEIIQKALEVAPNVFLDLNLTVLDESNPLAVCVQKNAIECLDVFLNWDPGILYWEFEETSTKMPQSLWELAALEKKSKVLHYLLEKSGAEVLFSKSRERYKSPLATVLGHTDEMWDLHLLLAQGCLLKQQRKGQGVRSFPKISKELDEKGGFKVTLCSGQTEVVDAMLYTYYLEKEHCKMMWDRMLKERQGGGMESYSILQQYLVECMLLLKEKQHAAWMYQKESPMTGRGLAMLSVACSGEERPTGGCSEPHVVDKIFLAWYALGGVHQEQWEQSGRLKPLALEEVQSDGVQFMHTCQKLRDMVHKDWEACYVEVRRQAIDLIQEVFRNKSALEEEHARVEPHKLKLEASDSLLKMSTAIAYKTLFEYDLCYPHIRKKLDGVLGCHPESAGQVWAECFGQLLEAALEQQHNSAPLQRPDLEAQFLNRWLEGDRKQWSFWLSQSGRDFFKAHAQYCKTVQKLTPLDTLLRALDTREPKRHLDAQTAHMLIEAYQLGRQLKEAPSGRTPRL